MKLIYFEIQDKSIMQTTQDSYASVVQKRISIKMERLKGGSSDLGGLEALLS